MKNVLLVFGGKSYEHDISVVTASQIFCKTKSEKFRLIPLYISRENKMFIYEKNKFDIKDFALSRFSGKNKNFKEVVFVSSEKSKLFAKSVFGLKEYLSVKNAVIACHGALGENGQVVSVFEQMGISCSSGSVDALGICMNKFLFKQTMKGLKIPVVYGFKLRKIDFENAEFKRKLVLRMRFLKFPLVIKPNSGGSSIGLFVVKNYDEFETKVNECFEFDEEVVVEKFIDNCREFNVAVVGDSLNFEVSEIDEPLKNNEILSFSDKYLSGEKSGKFVKTKGNSMVTQARNFPANIENDLSIKIKGIAAKIFKSLNLCGVVRIDFLYSEKQNKLYVCEVNAVPGSLAYYFYEGNKIVINDFVEKLIKISENNTNNYDNIHKEFITNILD